MIGKVLNDLNGVAIYPIVTLLLFFSVFGFTLIKVLKRKKSDDIEMANLPLEDGVTGKREANHG
ncbi:MAG TPA: hypothetical protein PLY93_07875 [Turneriella sp.]|nr:hypothetical protein [Turneriella sp.]